MTVSFEEFYAAHFHQLTVQLCAYTGDLGQAQDIAQDAFCKALTRWSTIAAYDDPAAWLRRVAWNLATSRWRRVKTATAFVRRHRHTMTVDGPSPDRVVLSEALATLPERQRRVVVLHYLADLPIAEIAEIAEMEGVAEGTVKTWLYRGRAALAARLADFRAEESNV